MNVENTTLFEAEAFPVQNAYERDFLLIVVKATYTFKIDEDGPPEVRVSDSQDPVALGDDYYGDVSDSSIRYASDYCFDKQATDIAMVGHAYAPYEGATKSSVFLSVGEVNKTVSVFGDRTWQKTMGIATISAPEPFDRIPLLYERAFGGIDDSSDKEKHWEAVPKNFIGTGLRAKKTNKSLVELKLPNFEDPKKPIKNTKKKGVPAGFGFISPNHPDRKQYAGTYDEIWLNDRAPFFPKDFDPKFFNAATPDLVYPGFLKGNEPVTIQGMTPQNEEVGFHLPDDPPLCMMELKGDSDPIAMALKIDKLFIDMDTHTFNIVWNCNLFNDNDFEDIEKILVYQDVVQGLKKKYPLTREIST